MTKGATMECAAQTPIDAHCAKCDDEMPTDPYLKVVMPMTDESRVRTLRVTSPALVEANPRAHDNVNWDHSQGAPPTGGPDNGETWVAHLAPGGHGPVTVTVAFHRECDLLGIGVALRGDADPVANRRKARAIAVGRAEMGTGAEDGRYLKTHKVKLVPGPGAVHILESRLAWMVWADEYGEGVAKMMRNLREIESVVADPYILRVDVLEALTNHYARRDLDRAPTPTGAHWQAARTARRVFQAGAFYFNRGTP